MLFQKSRAAAIDAWEEEGSAGSRRCIGMKVHFFEFIG